MASWWQQKRLRRWRRLWRWARAAQLAHQETQLGEESYTLRQLVQEGPAQPAWAPEASDQFRGHPRKGHTHHHIYSHLLFTTTICGRN